MRNDIVVAGAAGGLVLDSPPIPLPAVDISMMPPLFTPPTKAEVIQAAIRERNWDAVVAGIAAYLAEKPDDPDMINNLGTALRNMNQAAAAVPYFERSIELMEADKSYNRKILASAYTNYAAALMDMGEFDEAQAAARLSFAAYPNPLAQWALTIIYLTTGKFDLGWKLFKRRREMPVYVASRAYDVPEWDGETQCPRLLLVGEQGIGERLMYASVFDEVATKSGATMYIELTKEVTRLRPLFERSFPSAIIAEAGMQIPGKDITQVLMGDALRFFRPDFKAFKVHAGYLKVDPLRRFSFLSHLPGEGPIIGLSWRSLGMDHSAFKSISLMDFLPVMEQMPGARFVSLQYCPVNDTTEIDAFTAATGITIHQPMTPNQLMGDIDGTAALIAACDHVVTISNINAHMAGAVGTPVSLLLRNCFGRVWYWFTDREDSPFYPSMRIYRAGDVARTTIERMAADIKGGF